MKYHFTEVSRNRKTGPIPVVTSSRETCPPSCPLMGDGGCYAEGGPLRIHWDRITSGSASTTLDIDQLCQKVRRLHRTQLWRYGQAGDLPGVGEDLDAEACIKLARANANRPVIAFTHKNPYHGDNLKILREMAKLGFPVNLSADTLIEADELAETGLNVVVVLPTDYGRRTTGGKWSESLKEYRQRIRGLSRTTPRGRKVAICPATYTETRCVDCGACATKGPLRAVIGFPAHGNRKSIIGRSP